jgi:hypothetical protein
VIEMTAEQIAKSCEVEAKRLLELAAILRGPRMLKIPQINQMKEAGYTNTDLAHLLNVSESRIRRLLREARRG